LIKVQVRPPTRILNTKVISQCNCPFRRLAPLIHAISKRVLEVLPRIESWRVWNLRDSIIPLARFVFFGVRSSGDRKLPETQPTSDIINGIYPVIAVVDFVILYIDLESDRRGDIDARPFVRVIPFDLWSYFVWATTAGSTLYLIG
jgi:hypothetical protein